MIRRLALAACLLLGSPAWAALSPAMEWDVRVTAAASNINGCAFKSGASGTDYSQQDAAQFAGTDGASAGSSTTFTSAGATFTTAIVGNVLHFISAGVGTCTAGWYEVTARASNTSITLDRAPCSVSGTSITYNVGGACLTLSAVEPVAVAGNIIHIKDGGATHYNETLTITVGGGNGTPRFWRGFASTHNDKPTGSTRPTIDGAETRANCVDYAATVGNVFEYIQVEDATAANVTGATGTARFKYFKSSLAGLNGFAITSSGGIILENCEDSGSTGDGLNTATAATTVQVSGSYFHDESSNGIDAQTTVIGRTNISNTVVDTAGATGISLNCGTVTNVTVYNSVGATADGISYTTNNSTPSAVTNSILANNGRYGISRASGTVSFVISNYNDFFDNATSDYSAVTAGANDVTSDPQFTNAAAGDFSIGTNLKALGSLGAFPGALSTGYLDIGAAQRQEAGGGAGGVSAARIQGGM